MTTIDDVAKRIEALDDDFNIYSMSQKLPSAEQIATVEKELGMCLSAEHRALVQRFGALAIVAKEEAWPRPAALDIRPRWQFGYAIEVLGVLGGQSAPALDLVTQARAHQPRGATPLVPAIHIAGDAFVVGYDATGALFSWSAGAEPERIAPAGLLELLLARIDALAADKDRIKAAPPDNEDDDEDETDLSTLLQRLASKDTEERREAREAIAGRDQIPEAAVRAAIDCLPDEEVRDKAIEVLEESKSPLALEPLLRALERAQENPAWATEGEADKLFSAIGACGRGDERAVRTLAANLIIEPSHGGKFTALNAFKALAEMRSGAAMATARLLAVAGDADAWRRANAHATLLAVTGDVATHAPPLIELLDHEAEGGAAGAAARGGLRDCGAPSLPFLREAQAHPRPTVRDQAAKLVTAIERRATR